jgi:hypothetical protein
MAKHAKFASKADRDREARLQAIAAQGEKRPPSTDLAALMGVTTPPEAAEVAVDVPQWADAMPPEADQGSDSPEAPGEPSAATVTTADSPPIPHETPIVAPQTPQEKPIAAPEVPPEPEKAAKQSNRPTKGAGATDAEKTPPQPEKVAPWASAHPKVAVPFMMRLPEGLHIKLAWLKEHMPNTSIQKIVRVAIEKEVDALLKEYYK